MEPNRHRVVISSFMLRFVHEVEEETKAAIDKEQAEGESEVLQSAWRGIIKHIQSGEEHHFTTLDDAESFIKKFIGE
ncbi:MAG: hypothetical protein HXX08_07120 [Chloroflexi bacterium]|uniref:Uncharacterized protein n=1 Tax=Candidatus Chlorohelix allophototropha TaxID=3003348 RepID=A0A8T7LXE7_9CHLR|nr:hypothetical protein [Chloroflexota bacterium]WJW67504.1 hypothetical protein OZ401_000770 [Chloroflexota bacterium L227-S17]